MDGGYDDELFRRLAEVEPRSFWYRARSRLIVDVVRRHFPSAREILEVGSGSGGTLLALHRALPGARLVGAEPSSEGLAIARGRVPDDVELVELDARAMPYHDRFDVVGAFDVLEHIVEDDAAIAGLAQAARPGGGVILLVPQHPRLWSDMDRIARHVRRFTRRELRAKVEGAGLDIEYVGSFVFTLLPALVVSRFARRALGRSYDPVSELEPGPLNGVFEAILGFERRLIARRVSLPFGASLLLVARKPRLP